jgi:hypothetical protein
VRVALIPKPFWSCDTRYALVAFLCGVLLLGMPQAALAQGHLTTEAERDAFIRTDVLRLKKHCDEVFNKTDDGSTVGTRNASEAYVTCLEETAQTVAAALYRQDDIESEQFALNLERAEDSVLALFALSDQLALYCGAGSDKNCSYNGGTMYQITPYGHAFRLFEDLIVRMCEMSASDGDALLSKDWKAAFYGERFESEEE